MEVVNVLTFLLRAEDYVPRVHELQHIPDSLSKNFWFHSMFAGNELSWS